MDVIDDHSLRVYKHIINLINAICQQQIKFHLNMHLHSLANEASKSNSLYLVDCTITNNYGQLWYSYEIYQFLSDRYILLFFQKHELTRFWFPSDTFFQAVSPISNHTEHSTGFYVLVLLYSFDIENKNLLPRSRFLRNWLHRDVSFRANLHNVKEISI